MMRMGGVSLRRVGTVLLVALVAVGAFVLRAEAVTEIPMLEVTGTLERVEHVKDGEDGEVLVLNVEGKEASAPLFSDCHFLDERGTLIPKEEFLRRYMKRYVTVELSEADGAVYVCRVKTDA